MTSSLTLLSVALGGGLGALARWAISCWVQPVSLGTYGSARNSRSAPTVALFPLPTLVANLLACAALGIAIRLWTETTGVYSFLVVGCCGGLSTYSTFAVEVLALWRDQHRWVAMGYLATSILGGLLVLWLGLIQFP